MPSAILRIVGFFIACIFIIVTPIVGLIVMDEINKAIYEGLCEPRGMSADQCPSGAILFAITEILFIVIAGLYNT